MHVFCTVEGLQAAFGSIFWSLGLGCAGSCGHISWFCLQQCCCDVEAAEKEQVMRRVVTGAHLDPGW